MSDINAMIADLLSEGIMAAPGEKGILGKTASVVGKVGHGILNPVSTASSAMGKVGQLPGIRHVGAVANAALNPVSTAGAIGNRAAQLPGIRHAGMAANAALNPVSTAKAGLSKIGSTLSRF